MGLIKLYIFYLLLIIVFLGREIYEEKGDFGFKFGGIVFRGKLLKIMNEWLG